MKVLIAAGGTAGHVLPALAVARVLADGGDTVTFLGTETGQEARLVPAAGFALSTVDVRPFPRRPSRELAAAGLAAARSVRACRPLVEAADVVLGMGGYVSVPAGVAASRAGRPLVIHEQNAVAGLANRLLARRATVVALGVEAARASFPRRVPVRVTGTPLRADIVAAASRRAGDPAGSRRDAAAALGFRDDRPILLILGGSLGAARLNAAAMGGLRDLDVQALLLAGAAHVERLRGAFADAAGIRVEAFIDRMDLAYLAADLVVARAGAATCAELSVFGLPAVLVPYPHATGDHQSANARVLVEAGGAETVDDAAFDATALRSRVQRLLADRARLASMATAARRIARPRAGEDLAALLRSVA